MRSTPLQDPNFLDQAAKASKSYLTEDDDVWDAMEIFQTSADYRTGKVKTRRWEDVKAGMDSYSAL